MGKNYSRLYSTFEDTTFGFDQARDVLGIDDDRARLVLSRLRSKGHLIVFDKVGRRRVYRLIRPELATFAVGVGLESYTNIQGPYVYLTLLFTRGVFRTYGDKVCSIVVYGSVARGLATKSSDLDMLLIVEDLPQSYSERINGLVSIEFDQSVREERGFLRDLGYHADFSYLPLTPPEAEGFRPLYLEILSDHVVLFDRNGYFEKLSKIFEGKLAELGAKKVRVEGGGWYWILKPDIEFGEEVVL
ncbi:MAG: nucleotidyltransferase domain-containing protein [Candidatus Geothermarchaeales archaeon]